MFPDVFGIDHRDNPIQHQFFLHIIIHVKGLGDGTGVGHAGGLDHNVIELIAALHQMTENADQITPNGAADASVVHLEDLFFGANDQIVINADLAELIFDHRDLLAVIFGQDAVEQCGFACPQKARQNGHRHSCFKCVHHVRVSSIQLSFSISADFFSVSARARAVFG